MVVIMTIMMVVVLLLNYGEDIIKCYDGDGDKNETRFESMFFF